MNVVYEVHTRNYSCVKSMRKVQKSTRRKIERVLVQTSYASIGNGDGNSCTIVCIGNLDLRPTEAGVGKTGDI